MKVCAKCVMPETAESVDFSEPVCSVCKQAAAKKEVDWDARLRQLNEVVGAARSIGGDYDCIVPFSGGKDSTFTLYHVVERLRLKPLVVRFDHGFLRKRVLDNSQRVFRKLGCDVIHFTPNWHVVKKLMMESLLRRGDFCWHCHTGVFAYPMQIAVKWKVPLVIWGEGDNEYASWGDGDHGHERFDRVCSLGISAEDMRGMVGVDERDLRPFALPSRDELRGVRSIFLGSYVEWNPREQSALIKRELGWQGDEVEGVPPQYDYDKIECAMQGTRDYIKWLKRGFGRTAHLASIDVREGRISRDDAANLVSQYDGKRPASLDTFLELLGIPEKEFMEIVENHVVHPHKMPTRIERANWIPEDLADEAHHRVIASAER